MALKMTNHGTFFNKFSRSPFTVKGSGGKKKKGGEDGKGRNWDSVATWAGVAMGHQLLTLKQVAMRGSLCCLGKDNQYKCFTRVKAITLQHHIHGIALSKSHINLPLYA